MKLLPFGVTITFELSFPRRVTTETRILRYCNTVAGIQLPIIIISITIIVIFSPGRRCTTAMVSQNYEFNSLLNKLFSADELGERVVRRNKKKKIIKIGSISARCITLVVLYCLYSTYRLNIFFSPTPLVFFFFLTPFVGRSRRFAV